MKIANRHPLCVARRDVLDPRSAMVGAGYIACEGWGVLEGGGRRW